MIRDRVRRIARRIVRRRDAARVKTGLPVLVDFGGSGVTRDVSPTGVFFESDVGYAVDSTIHFVIEFRAPAGSMRMDCSGIITRVEKQGKKVGVAVKLRSQRLKSAG